jgi:hypothetical protein
MKNSLKLAYIIIALFVSSCIKQEVGSYEVLPDAFVHTAANDLLDYPVDSGSFIGLHKYIFSTTCAASGCHDGSFEPDFRTVQSAYNTLVNHKIVKNTTDNRFEYRVIPNDVENSMLYERVTTTDNVLGKMPLYDFPLTPREVSFIEDWINAGAPDGFGNSPTVFNEEPAFFGMRAYLNTQTDTLDDEYIVRNGAFTDPYEIPKDTIVKIWFGLYDVDAEGQFFPGNELTFNQIRFSDKYYDFINTAYKDLNIEDVDTYLYAPMTFDTTVFLPYFHHFTVNTSNYDVGEIVFMRVYVKDADHSTPTEIPQIGSPIYLSAHFSFKIVP